MTDLYNLYMADIFIQEQKIKYSAPAYGACVRENIFRCGLFSHYYRCISNHLWTVEIMAVHTKCLPKRSCLVATKHV